MTVIPAGMTPLLLIDTLVETLTGVVRNYALETGTGAADRAPQVVAGWLPPKTNDDDDPDFPYVIARLVAGTDTEEQGTVRVRLLVGTHSEDADGWRDALNVVERIRQALMTQRTIDDRYRLQMPLEWEMPDDQPYPQFVAQMTTIWTMYRPVELPGTEL